MDYCYNCGSKLDPQARECPNCHTNFDLAISKINKDIRIKNSQTTIVRRSWYAAGIFFILMILPFQEWSPVSEAWGLAFISFFLFLVSIVVALLSSSREKKLEKLITGESLLAQWRLSPEQKKRYVSYLFKQEVGKNILILLTISLIAIVVWGIFILFIDEGKVAMILILLGLITFLALFAFGMPYYYRFKNNKAGGNILLGAKYAYVNGFFHNWDFPLSGLSKVRIIKKPFYGINLVYYYTDRTLNHSEELFIPANENVDLSSLITALKEKNKTEEKKGIL